MSLDLLSVNSLQPLPPLQWARVDEGLRLEWPVIAAELEQASVVTGPWSLLLGATSPWTNTAVAGGRFYRLRD